MHTPVLLQQVMERLAVKSGGRYIDATFGEGGYSQEIASRGGKVLALDLDSEQLKAFEVSRLPNLDLVNGNFADIEAIAKEKNFCPVEGVVFDLGLSMRQLKHSNRGFSYKNLDEPLDMRLDTEKELTAAELIKRSSQEDLFEILAKNSEELRSKEIALAVKSRRNPETVGDLVRAIDRATGISSQAVYARVFQALRIAVNDEFGSLRRGLQGAVNILSPQGRIVVVTFHSLEDRIVKNFVKNGKLKFLEKKPFRGLKYFERSAKIRTIINS